ncbi:hypothetical protein [Tardiphaga sp. 709]|uniref:hypothetical protein n=1 Tax=Tardiphaga sp. 709 TaxID=3076039 RepID=UPI0028E8D834|nr:hypothetical protein [Tardiphaga sp. 709]WNV08978.1 hypothetical protein RSO67_26490 [Tardiphaga sp. 709]
MTEVEQTCPALPSRANAWPLAWNFHSALAATNEKSKAQGSPMLTDTTVAPETDDEVLYSVIVPNG